MEASLFVEIEKDKKEQEVIDFIYEKEHRYLIRTLQICPQELTFAESIKKEIQEEILKNDANSRTDDRLTLPGSISAGTLSWNENLTDNSFLFILITFLICILVEPIKENEISKKIKLNKKVGQVFLSHFFVSFLELVLHEYQNLECCHYFCFCFYFFFLNI